MAEKYHQQQQMYPQMYPLAPSSVMPRSYAEESGAGATDEAILELKKKKRMKCWAYFAAFVVFQTIIILVFALVLMRVRTPKLRLNDVRVVNNVNGNIRLNAQVRVKNTNFGHYEFDSSIVTLKNGVVPVGQFVIHEGRARTRSTKKISVIVDVTNPLGAGGSSNSGVLELSSETKLRGKVEFLRVLHRRKSVEMDCTMSINLSTNIVQDLRCK